MLAHERDKDGGKGRSGRATERGFRHEQQHAEDEPATANGLPPLRPLSVCASVCARAHAREGNGGSGGMGGVGEVRVCYMQVRACYMHACKSQCLNTPVPPK